MDTVQINAFPVMLGALLVLAIGYRYYSAFIAAKVLALDGARRTAAVEKNDGHNFVPTSKWVLFGHHFAAITGAGPLVGPMLAAQFGYAPGFIWLVAGCCLAGAVHDSMVLWASVRRGGKSLPDIVKQEISPFVGFVAAIAILFILVIALLDIIIPGVVPKWAIFAPIFIPLFLRLDVAPQTVLAAYRIGDSPMNVITPLMVYLPFIVVVAQRYKKDAGLGTIISLMIPYTVIVLVLWTLFFVVWYVTGIPMGPGYPVKL